MTREDFRERFARRVRRVERALIAYGQEYVSGQGYQPERRKVIDRGTTLSPHEHRRERQIKDSRSVTVVKIAAAARERWSLHRSTVQVYAEYFDDSVRIYASHKRLLHVEEIRWDKLDLPENSDVLDELEFLLAPLLDRLPKVD